MGSTQVLEIELELEWIQATLCFADGEMQPVGTGSAGLELGRAPSARKGLEFHPA